MIAGGSLYLVIISRVILFHCFRNSGNNTTSTRIWLLFLIDICVFKIMPAAEPDHFPASSITLTKSYEARRKTNTKFFYTNTCPFCSNEMAKFMYEYAHAKDRNGSQ